MENQNASRIVISDPSQSKKLSKFPHFTHQYMPIFVLVFGILGTLIIWRSFAATPAPAALAFAHGEVLVKFKADTPQTTQDDLLSKQNAHVKQEIPHIGVKVITVPDNAETAVSEALSHNPAVEFAEKNWIAKPQEQLPNDPYFPNGNYALGGGAWGWQTSHTTEAWDITKGDLSVVIAILDTGLKPAGLDFDGQLVPGWNVTNNTADYTTNAGNHGTYVAGAAGLAIDNGVGNAGYCPHCKLMPVQVGTDSGATFADMASGITWATDHGARIQNLSWAGTSSSSTLASAVSYARSKNAVVFAAAGNANCDCQTYPAATPGVLGVGGVGNAGSKAGDSNYGSWVAVAAPEGNMTAWPTLNSGPGYGPVGGTSLASPAAAGMAGLILSAKLDLTGAQLEQAVESTATPTSFTVKYGAVNPLAALASLGFTDPQPSSAPLQVSPAQLYYEVTGSNGRLDAARIAPLSSAPHPGSVLVRGAGGWTGSTGLSLYNVVWQRCDAAGNNCVASSQRGNAYAVQSEDVGWTIKEIYTVKNSVGQTSGFVLSQSVTAASAGDTAAPTLSIATPANGSTISGNVYVSSTDAADNVGVTRVEFYDNGKLFGTFYTPPLNGTTWSAYWSAGPAGSSHTLTAKAYDTSGNAGTSSPITVTVAGSSAGDTTAPSISLTSPANAAVVSGSVPVTATATDNTGVTKVEFYADGSLFSTVTAAPYSTTWNAAGLAAGSSHALTAKAYDAAGNVGTSSTVTVSIASTGDSTPPAISITTPLNNSTLSGTSTTISAKATDNIGVTSMKLYIDGSLKSSSTIDTLTYKWNTRKVTKGTHTILVQAFDAAGNTVTSTITVNK